jgi:hypothetical protein
MQGRPLTLTRFDPLASPVVHPVSTHLDMILATPHPCSPPPPHTHPRFKKYLSNLAYLIDQEGDREDLEFEWSSPLSGRPGRFFRVNGLCKEHALVGVGWWAKGGVGGTCGGGGVSAGCACVER